MLKIDTRGMSCPEPVLMTKKAVDGKPSEIEILAGDNTAKNNIKRFLESKKYSVEVLCEGEDFILRAEASK